MIMTTFDQCIVSGDLKLINNGVVKFEQLANNENEVAVGEQIVTSNISSKYLQGLLIGYVSEVNVDSNNLTRSGYIIPAVDFKKLQDSDCILRIHGRKEGRNVCWSAKRFFA